MREFWLLSRLQLSSLFGINKAVHSRGTDEKKKGRRTLSASLAMVFALLYVSTTYSLLLASALAPMGQLSTLLGLMGMAAMVIVLFFSVFETRSVLFGFGSTDLVLSWPVPATAVAASRVATMYVYNLAYALLFLLPAGVVYAVYAAPAWTYWPAFLVLTLFVPALPTIVGALLGTLLSAATARMKNRSVLQSVFSVLLALGIMFLSFSLTGENGDIGANLAGSAGGLLAAWPPAQWYESALCQGNAVGGLLLVAVSAAALAILLWMMARWFLPLSARLNAAPKSDAFRMRAQKSAGAVRALYRKEWKRYLSSSIYITNTAFGYVLLLALAVVLGFVRPPSVMEMLTLPELPGLGMALPFLLGWITAMSATTSSAISLEGKYLWQIKAMPVSARDWLLSKLFVSLTLAVPCSVVFGLVIALGVGAGPLETVWMVAVPLVFAVFSGVFGLFVNIRSYRFDFANDTEIVKQSMPTFVAVFGSMLFCFIPAVLTVLLAKAWVAPACCAVALLASYLMWLDLKKTGDKRLYRM